VDHTGQRLRLPWSILSLPVAVAVAQTALVVAQVDLGQAPAYR